MQCKYEGLNPQDSGGARGMIGDICNHSASGARPKVKVETRVSPKSSQAANME